MTLKILVAALGAGVCVLPLQALAADLSIAVGSIGQDVVEMRGQLDKFQEATGHTVTIVELPGSSTDQFAQYRLWLSAQNPDIDVYRTDVIWAPQLAANFVDLTEPMADIVGEHLPEVVASQTVEGRLVAMPLFTDAPALYYRTDLLEKYGEEPPATWEDLQRIAEKVLEGERAEGNTQLTGYVFQGAAYEGLTCNVVEWLASSGGGTIVDAEGEITVNNAEAAAALDRAAGWVGTISPGGVLSYMEEEARGVWQTGNAVFMRNWPYAYPLGEGADAAVSGKFDVVPLPAGPGGQSAGCLGGWNLAVSEYSPDKEAAIELVRFLSSADSQKERALMTARLPTIAALYEDEEIAAAQPIVPRWGEVVAAAVARPSAPTLSKYNEVSREIWTAAHQTMSGSGTGASNVEALERSLRRIRRSGW